MAKKKQKYYKAFDKDLKCRNMQYEIGETYEMDKKQLVICQQGYHFCKSIEDCYRFYPPIESTRICEVEPLGDIQTIDDLKFCTNKIKIIKEIKGSRKKCNTGEGNTGFCNSGSYNTGNSNSGNWNTGNDNKGHSNTGMDNLGTDNTGCYNTGNWNSGNRNDGKCNTGDYNIGDCNTGNHNSGNWNTGNYNTGILNTGNYNAGECNTGYHNTGDYNSGDYNAGNYNSGIFNTEMRPYLKIFDKDSNWTMSDWVYSEARLILSDIKDINSTDKSKQYWFIDLPAHQKNLIYNIPNFDPDKFRECTGIDVSEDETFKALKRTKLSDKDKVDKIKTILSRYINIEAENADRILGEIRSVLNNDYEEDYHE